MSKRIAVVSQKGGVGKTTVSVNLAVALAKAGQRTLLIDYDPQGGVGLSLAKGESALDGLVELITQNRPVEQVLLQTKLEGLTLLPRGRLDPVDVSEFEQALADPSVRQRLISATDGFDFTIIDTPAGLGTATRAALDFANLLLVVTQADPLAMRSLGQVVRVAERVRSTSNPDLELLGFLLSMVDLRAEPSRQTAEAMWTGFDRVLETTIPRSAVFGEAQLKGVPLLLMGGELRPEASRFTHLAAEVIRLTAPATMSTAAHTPDQPLL